MTRLIARPQFWIALVLLSFAVNVFLALFTLRHHIRYLEEHQTPFNFFTASLDFRISAEGRGPLELRSETHSMPEGDLWRRILRRESSSGCGPGRKGIIERNSTLVQGLATFPQLPPKGFRERVQEFVDMSDGDNRKKPISLRGSPSNSTLRMKGSSHCLFPAATSCSDSQYSVLMYSTARDPRTLLLHLMACKAYPSINDITLVLPSEDVLHDLQWYSAYGSRILDWKNQGTVQIIVEPDLWTAVAQVRTKESAVLWIDGDRPKHWNGTIFRTIFRIWRQHPRALVVSMDSTQDSGNEVISAFPAFGMHGTIMHRHWFCFLDHPVLDPLRRYLGSVHSWEGILSGLSIIFNQLGDGHILAVPPDGTAKQSEISDAWENMVVNNEERSTTDAIERMAIILDYFGCTSAARAVAPLQAKSTCVERNDETDLVFIGDAPQP